MIVTIGGRFGSGARDVAEIFSEKTGYTLYTNEKFVDALKECGIDVESEVFKFFDESTGEKSVQELKKNSNLQRRSLMVSYLSDDVAPFDERIKKAESEAINKLADNGNCIFVGRCADYYLAGREGLVRVFAYNKEQNCIDHIAGKFNLPENEARQLVRRSTKRRAEYSEYFAKKKWDDPASYDLTLNIDTLGREEAAEVLAAYCEKKQV